MKCFQLLATRNNKTGKMTYFVKVSNEGDCVFKRISKTEFETTKRHSNRIEGFEKKPDKEFTREYCFAYYDF